MEAAGSGAHLDVSRVFSFIFYLPQDLGLVGSFTSGILAGGGCSVRERQGVNGSWNFQGGNLEIQAKAWQQEQREKKFLVFWVAPLWIEHWSQGCHFLPELR